ncbi:MAG: 50S ribosomal protein L17 [Flavobacteriales bacterium]|nr:50S ribosomal protein L17 [Flavobacteriales bacterium]
MRHGNKINQLGRTTSHRHAMMSNMASLLIFSKRIFTTLAKAKALRKYIEPLVTKAKNDNMHSRRIVFSYLQNKHSVKELFSTVADKIGDRPGGYTRILKTGNRLGDNAEMCMIEFVDFNETLGGGKLVVKEAATAKRTRRGSAKKETKSDTPEAKVEKKSNSAVAEETVVEDAAEIVEAKTEEVVEAKAEEVAEEVVDVKDEAAEIAEEEANKGEEEKSEE